MSEMALPQDILLHVFSFLSPVDLSRGVRRTCRTWHCLSYDRSLWKRVNLFEHGLHNKLSSTSFVEFLRGISDFIQSLNLERTSFDSDGYLHEDFRCSDLKEINFFGAEISSDTMLKLLRKYNDLESVALSLNIRSSSGFLSIVQQLSEMKKLKKLRIHNCCVDERYLFAGDTAKPRLYQMFQTHKKLESLSFVHCDLPSDLYKIPIEQNTELREVKFVMCSNVFTGVFKTRIGVNFHQLKTLNLTGTSFDDYLLKEAIERAPYLERVYINNCWSAVTDFGINFLAEQCSNLTTLVISKTRLDKSRITTAGLETIAGHCKLLKTLVVNYCSGIRDSSVVAIATGCKYLEELQVAGCSGLSDMALLRLAENCTKLRKLNLEQCEQISSASVNYAMKNLKQLKYLNLENCYRITSFDLITVNNKEEKELSDQNNEEFGIVHNSYRERHSRISVILLSHCPQISASCLGEIASFCPDLRELTLQECSQLTDSSIEKLVKSCKYLTKLNISGGFGSQVTKLTDKSLHSLGKWCENLVHLVIFQNPNITINGVINVVTCCPKIWLISVSIGNRVHIPGLKIAVSKVESKLFRLEAMGKASSVDIYVYANQEHKIGKKYNTA